MADTEMLDRLIHGQRVFTSPRLGLGNAVGLSEVVDAILVQFGEGIQIAFVGKLPGRCAAFEVGDGLPDRLRGKLTGAGLRPDCPQRIRVVRGGFDSEDAARLVVGFDRVAACSRRHLLG